MDKKEAILHIKEHIEHHKIGEYSHLKLKEALDMAISVLTQPNEWVSVDERLPPVGKNVLVYVYWHEHCGVYMGWSNNYGWTVFCGIESRPDMQVSHWMPLPAPPNCRPPEGEEDT